MYCAQLGHRAGRDAHRRRCSGPPARRRSRAPRSAARARRSAAAPTPGRAWPSPRACRPASRRASATTTQPKPNTVATAPAPARVARPISAPQAWASSDDAALAAAVLALGREDQPRGHVHEHAEAEQDAPSANHSRTVPAGMSQRRARPAHTPPSQRPARGRVIGVGSPSSIAMHCRTRTRRSPVVMARSCLRDFPEMGTTRRTCSHWSSPAQRAPPRTRCARASTRPTRSGSASRRSCSSLDGETLDLLPQAREVLERVAGDPRFKLELPASQLEIVTPPCAGRRDRGRVAGSRPRDLAAAAAPIGRLMTAGAHPFAAELGVLTDDPRYAAQLDEYGERARRQLVSGLHLHVSLGGADRTLAVYNALRSHLPELAALAANAPFHDGPRHRPGLDPPDDRGQPAAPGRAAGDPELGVVRAALSWGEASDTVPDARRWWFELRLHATYGTLELRVPDAQSSIDDVHGVAAFAFGLVQCAGRALRRGRAAARRRLVADRREPLVGDARRRRAARSRTSTPASACRPASCCARVGRFPTCTRRRARALDRGQRRRSARRQAGPGCGAAAYLADRSSVVRPEPVVHVVSHACAAACALNRARARVVEERVVGLGEREDLVVQRARPRAPRCAAVASWRSRARRAPP